MVSVDRRWLAARRALFDGLAFTDGEGRLVDIDRRFAELLAPALGRSSEALAACEGQCFHALFEGPELAAIRERVAAPPRTAELEHLSLPRGRVTLRMAALDPIGSGRVIVAHELPRAPLDGDTELLREQLALRDQLIAELRQTITELSAPLIPVGARISVVPFIGPFDDERVEGAIERMLELVAGRPGQTVVVDLTGISEFDLSAADGLARMRTTLAFVGAHMVLCGVRPDLALALALDPDTESSLGGLEVFSTLDQALASTRRP